MKKLNMTKSIIVVFVLICALIVSVGLNVWLYSEVTELGYLKKPMVHFLSYEWQILPSYPSWEFENVVVNFTLFNSGYAAAEFTLSIDVLNQNGTSFLSKEMLIQIDATSKKEFNDVTFVHDLLFDSEHHVSGLEFYCVYFHEYFMGNMSSTH
jgi:hypothetical protein